MDMGFAIIRSLTRHRKPLIRFLFIGSHLLLRASFRPRLAASVISPLRFAITSRPSRCEEDLHLLAVKPARHTKESPASRPGSLLVRVEVFMGELSRRAPRPL